MCHILVSLMVRFQHVFTLLPQPQQSSSQSSLEKYGHKNLVFIETNVAFVRNGTIGRYCVHIVSYLLSIYLYRDQCYFCNMSTLSILSIYLLLY